MCDTTLVHPVDSVAFRDSVRRREALESMRGYTIYTDSNTWKKDTTKVDTMPKSKR